MGYCMYLRKGETHTKPVGGVLAGELAVGSTVKLNVNGVATEFIVVHQGKPSSIYDDSCDGTWLLMKDCYESHVWSVARQNDYEKSSIHLYLNGDFFNLFDENSRNIIKEVKIPYRKGTGMGGSTQSGANGLSTKIFLLSGKEVGFASNSYLPGDGDPLLYFSTGDIGTKRVSYLNNSATAWWMRSPNTNTTYNSWIVTSTGINASNAVVNAAGIRPALILPSDAVFDQTTLILKP